MGDLNINRNNLDNYTTNYLSILNSNYFNQLISLPTRITNHSSTLIDHMFTNISNYFINCGTISTCIADHLPIFAIFNDLNMHFNKCMSSVKDSMTLNHNLFVSLIHSIDWSDLYGLADPNLAYNFFIDIFSSNFQNSHFSSSKCNLKHNTIKKPWVTPAILVDINKRDKLFYKWKRHKLDCDLERKYKDLRNQINNNIKLCKKTYFENKMLSALGNPNLIWKTIFEATNTKKLNCNLNSPLKLVVNDVEFADDIDIANAFNDYFTNIAHKLKSNLPPFSISNSNIKCKLIDSSIYLSPVSEIEVIKAIDNLSNKKSTGPDNISNISIKLTKISLAKPLAFIINLIFSTGIFPAKLKIAKIIPIFKSGDPRNTGNYRPIALLSNFDKIIESCLYSRFTDFISKNNILSEDQFGFRPKLSCETALLEFTNDIAINLDTNKFSLATFLDISKAFDTIQFCIMKSKLEHLGFRGIVLNLIMNYLTDRQQYVYVNNSNSFYSNVIYGVPQGSILGPLLFLLYINDLPNVLNFSKIIMYADDVVIWYSHNCLNIVTDIMNSEMKNIYNWYTENKLSINFSKSNYMIFHGNKKIIPSNMEPIFLGSNSLEQVKVVKYLGIYIQNNLRWSHQIKCVTTKIAAYVGIISKIRHYFSLKIILMYYYSFIHSHISYAISIWGNTYQSNLKPIFILQKKSY